MARVHGTEMEWAIQVPGSPEGHKPHSQPESKPLDANDFNKYASAYLKDRPYIGNINYTFLENGSRFYADIGNKRETTTNEDTSYMSTVASEIDNERLMYDVLTTPIKDFNGTMVSLGDFALQKRAIDDKGNNWGYHENYNVPATIKISPEELALLAIHLATRNVYCGSGYLGILDSGEARFYTAQKANGCEVNFGLATTKARPVVNTKDEPHASKDSFKRLHVITGDPFMNPLKGFMQLGTTSLTTELMIQGEDVKQFGFKPLDTPTGLAHFIRALAADNTATSEEFEVAIDMQRRIQQLAAKLPLSSEQERVVSEWDEILYHLKKRDLKHAGTKVEWIMRRDMLKRHHEKSGAAMNSLEMLQHDRRFDRIDFDPDSKNKSIGLALRETAWSQWMPSESLIRERRTNAPTTTRAALRSRFIKHFHELNGQLLPEGGAQRVVVDWARLSVDGRVVSLGDPYATTNRYLDMLIDEYSAKAA